MTPDATLPKLSYQDRQRIRTAATYATKLYPGPTGELLAREFLAWDEFGYRIAADRLVMRAIDHIHKQWHAHLAARTYA